jgi:hypothetical protein
MCLKLRRLDLHEERLGNIFGNSVRHLADVGGALLDCVSVAGLDGEALVRMLVDGMFQPRPVVFTSLIVETGAYRFGQSPVYLGEHVGEHLYAIRDMV